MTTDTGRVFENILFLLLGATAVIIILQNAYDREWKDGQSRRNLPDKIRRVPDHRECERKIINGDPSRIVCVCNASYCDDFPKLNLSSDEPIAVVYKTSKSGLRFQRTTAKITDKNSSKKGLRMKVNAGETFQTMIGFGGAFTDAAGINLDHLSPKSRANLMRSYFGDDGIQYSLGRVPIASCDFSTREYSYDDVENDFELKHFSLAEEDYKFKIPYILNAVNLTHGAINLFASPWSSPGWMKTNGRMKGGGKLIGKVGGKYYKSWANYFVKFLDQYAVNGVKFWGLTVQNEPTTGSDLKWPWQTLFFDDALQRDFIKSDLGPALKASKLGRNISLMIYDDNRPAAKSWAYTIFGDKNASDYVAGLAVHWYLDSASSPDAYSEIHKVYPDKFILATEACSGAQPWDKGVILGSWNRGMDYALNIFDDIDHFVSGWTDWNMCLDERGGPNWVANFVDAPVIVNGSNDEFYKQPMFYVMGHFSKFIRPASARISLSYPEQRNLRGIAFSTPDSRRVLVLLNTDHEKPLNITVEDAAMGGKTFDVTLETETIATIVWNKPPYSALRNRVALSFFNDRHFFIFLTCLEALDIVWSC